MLVAHLLHRQPRFAFARIVRDWASANGRYRAGPSRGERAGRRCAEGRLTLTADGQTPPFARRVIGRNFEYNHKPTTAADPKMAVNMIAIKPPMSGPTNSPRQP